MSSFSRKWFRLITTNFLIYNICWEDPAIDRELLEIDEASELLVITSAGDNVFSYLLDHPRSVSAVDVNACQTALFELKLSLFRYSNYMDLFELFAKGKTVHYQSIYRSIRAELSEESRDYWDLHIHRFNESGRGFYYSGLTGLFARLINGIIRFKGIQEEVHELVQENDRNKREALYHQISNRLWRGPLAGIWKWDGVLSLAGIPSEQRKAIGNLNAFMDQVFRKVFVDHSAIHNPFWRLYLDGHYKEPYLPDYLMPQHFDVISNAGSSISFHSNTLSDFLSKSDQRFSHFVLLDHMDWLSVHMRDDFRKEWIQIFKHAKPGARILFRTAYPDASFLPDFVLDKLNFLPVNEHLIIRDRVGTYPRTFLASVDV